MVKLTKQRFNYTENMFLVGCSPYMNFSAQFYFSRFFSVSWGEARKTASDRLKKRGERKLSLFVLSYSVFFPALFFRAAPPTN